MNFRILYIYAILNFKVCIYFSIVNTNYKHNIFNDEEKIIYIVTSLLFSKIHKIEINLES